MVLFPEPEIQKERLEYGIKFFKKEIQNWWDAQADRFFSQQAQFCRWVVVKLKDEILYSKVASDKYDTFWCKFPEEMYNWLQRL